MDFNQATGFNLKPSNKKYATTIHTVTQLPVYTAEEFIKLKTELLRIDKRVNNDLYGPVTENIIVSTKKSTSVNGEIPR